MSRQSPNLNTASSLLPLFPEWTTPAQRLLLSSQGNLQLLLRAFFNEPIILSVHEHSVAKELQLPRDFFDTLKIASSSAGSYVPEAFSSQPCHVIRRTITLGLEKSKRQLTIDKSICFLKKGNSLDSTVYLDDKFLAGSIGIGQYYQAKDIVPRFFMIDYTLGKVNSNYFFDARFIVNPEDIKLHRLYLLYDDSLLCLIDESIMTLLFDDDIKI